MHSEVLVQPMAAEFFATTVTGLDISPVAVDRKADTVMERVYRNLLMDRVA